MNQSIDTLLGEWTTAELTADTSRLSALLAEDFYGVGPLGFVLPRSAWLARHSPGQMTYESFGLDEIQTHQLGDTVLVTARNDTRGTYQGHPVPGAVRATLVIARVGGDAAWRIAAIHMSFIAGTTGAPGVPVPGRGNTSASEGNPT